MLQLNYEEELNVANRSVALAKQSGKNLGCYLMDVASAYQHLNDTTQCLSHLNEAYRIIKDEHAPARYGRILAAMLKAYSDFHHYDKVDSLLKIGMKPAQIAKVMDAKIQTVWNRVKRAEEICGNMKSTQ